MGSAREAILEALENLSSDELKKFKMKLLTVPLREGFGRIPRGALLPMDALDLSDKLVSFYLEDYSMEISAAVLRDMGLREVAQTLRVASVQSGSKPVARQTSAPPQMAAMPAQHFMDKHRQALISRVTDVDGVLDALYGKVLTEEQYQAVRAESTSSAKMRKLFSYAPAWNVTCKDLLLDALRKVQPYLVTDLEQS